VGIGLAVSLTVLALFLRYRDEYAGVLPRPRSSLPQSPTAAISALIGAARNKDVAGYLRLTDGDLRRSLEQTHLELGAEGFREHLRQFAAGIKGVAVPGGAPGDVDVVTLDVEIVFADRNERQRMTFARRRGGWVITSMEKAEMIKPPIPYGTPVFEEPPAQRGDES
jgi:hypothetical protein